MLRPKLFTRTKPDYSKFEIEEVDGGVALFCDCVPLIGLVYWSGTVPVSDLMAEIDRHWSEHHRVEDTPAKEQP